MSAVAERIFAGGGALVVVTAALHCLAACRLPLVAVTTPEVMLRVAAVLMALNASPQYFLLERAEGETLRIEVHVRGATDLAIDMLRRKLLQLTCVAEVTVQLAI